MFSPALASLAPQPSAADASPSLAPRPRTLAETGLDLHFLAELLLKHLHVGGVLTLGRLAERLALAGSVLETVLGFLRKESRIEVLGGASSGSAELRYALTERGRNGALEGLLRSGYIGPAPVPLDAYTAVVRAQSVRRTVITRQAMREAFAGVVIRESLLDQFGPALHSGRALFVYGQPGTGKSFICQRLAGLLGDTVLVPHAIGVGEVVVQIFDPALHRPVANVCPPASATLRDDHDPRYVPCRRPAALTGGELTLDMLELQYDADRKLYRAPLQLKASNGLYLIDDLGRQRVPPADLLNRWIVPMDAGVDYLTLGSGQRFAVPFDVVLVFSTNLDPLTLADEAFLRRLGYKIRFDALDPFEYETIWRQVCAQLGIEFDPAMLRYALEHLYVKDPSAPAAVDRIVDEAFWRGELFYAKSQVPLLPCHPRDLLGLVADHCRYCGEPVRVTPENLDFAWNTYFIRPNGAAERRPAPEGKPT